MKFEDFLKFKALLKSCFGVEYSYRVKFSVHVIFVTTHETLQIFKRQKNNQDSSDVDNFWTKSNVPTWSTVSKSIAPSSYVRTYIRRYVRTHVRTPTSSRFCATLIQWEPLRIHRQKNPVLSAFQKPTTQPNRVMTHFEKFTLEIPCYTFWRLSNSKAYRL